MLTHEEIHNRLEPLIIHLQNIQDLLSTTVGLLWCNLHSTLSGIQQLAQAVLGLCFERRSYIPIRAC